MSILLNLDPHEKISLHFELWEALRSSTAERLGFSNLPTQRHYENIKKTALEAADPLRAKFGSTKASSWYRSARLNAHIPGSSLTSAHREGLAVDLQPKRFLRGLISLRDVFEWVVHVSGIDYDQCIYEYGGWIHIGLSNAEPRHEELMKFANSRYLPYDPEDLRVR